MAISKYMPSFSLEPVEDAQEEGLLECPQTRLRLILAIFLCERVDNLFFIWSYSIESGFGQSAG